MLRAFWPSSSKPYVKVPGGLYGPPSRTGRASFHNGVDVALPVGTPVLSPGNGVVQWVDRVDDDASGLHVGVRLEGGLVVSFAHLSRVDVAPNQYVHEGDVLGLSGNSGRSTGPHVHVRVRTPTEPHVDPEPLFPSLPRVGVDAGGLVPLVALVAVVLS